jgi:hypothetical protein
MILLLGIAAGLLIGIIRARIAGKTIRVPELSQIWLVLAAVIPQLLIFQIPYTAGWFSDTAAAAVLVISQLTLLVFIWFNRDKTGILIMGLGLLLNLLVITLNGGLMPVAPETAAALYPDLPLTTWEIGTRPGWSKNILLRPEDTHLAWLSDAIILPGWFPWTKALSPGDLFIVLGSMWLLAQESLIKSTPPKKPVSLEEIEINLIL